MRNNGPLMPFHTPNFPMDCKRDQRESDIECFLAGDVRANEQVGIFIITLDAVLADICICDLLDCPVF